MKRIAVGLVLLLLFVAAILLGEYVNGLICSGLICVVIAICVWEVRCALGERLHKRYDVIIAVYALLLGIVQTLFGVYGTVVFTFCIFLAGVLVTLFGVRDIETEHDTFSRFVFLLIYPGLLLCSLLIINGGVRGILLPLEGYVEMPYYTAGIALVIVVSSCTDMGAYLIGVLFGRHKLCPVVSPKKTTEGMFGGILGGLIGAVAAYCLIEIVGILKSGLPSLFGNTVTIYLIAGIFGSALTQIGDLAASYIKRVCNVKDYSRLLGAHGGMMDRFDGIMFCSCLVSALYLLAV